MRRFLAVKKLAISFYSVIQRKCLPHRRNPETHRWVKLPTFLNAESWRNWTPRNHVPLPPGANAPRWFQPCPIKRVEKEGILLNLATGILGSSQLMRHHFSTRSFIHLPAMPCQRLEFLFQIPTSSFSQLECWTCWTIRIAMTRSCEILHPPMLEPEQQCKLWIFPRTGRITGLLGNPKQKVQKLESAVIKMSNLFIR